MTHPSLFAFISPSYHLCSKWTSTLLNNVIIHEVVEIMSKVFCIIYNIESNKLPKQVGVICGFFLLMSLPMMFVLQMGGITHLNHCHHVHVACECKIAPKPFPPFSIFFLILVEPFLFLFPFTFFLQVGKIVCLYHCHPHVVSEHKAPIPPFLISFSCSFNLLFCGASELQFSHLFVLAIYSYNFI